MLTLPEQDVIALCPEVRQVQRCKAEHVVQSTDSTLTQSIPQCMCDIVQSNEGKKLLLEATYSLGMAMLTLAHHIPDLPRERSVVAFFRLKGGAQAVGPSINAVMKLCAATGFTPSAKQPPAGGLPHRPTLHATCTRQYYLLPSGTLLLTHGHMYCIL